MRTRAASRRWLPSGSLLFMLVALVMVGAAGPAHGHTSLESSDPGDGARLSSAPAAVQLVFSEQVLDGPNRITVTGPNGEQWQRAGTLEVNGDTVTTQLKNLGPAGQYTVSYRVLSVDGHPVAGDTSFTLTEPGGAATTTEPDDAGTPAAAASTAEQQPSQAAQSAAMRAAEPGDAGGVGVWPWLAGAGVLVCGLVVLLARRGRTGPKGPADTP